MSGPYDPDYVPIRVTYPKELPYEGSADFRPVWPQFGHYDPPDMNGRNPETGLDSIETVVYFLCLLATYPKRFRARRERLRKRDS